MTPGGDRITNEYFGWISERVRDPADGFDSLMNVLFKCEFIPPTYMDGNRAIDGVNLRHQFADDRGYSRMLIDEVFSPRGTPIPASMLEVMAALAIRCERTMSDPAYGDRTKVWFYTMIESMELENMRGEHFSERRVRTVIRRFLNRKYEPDGRGSLFWVPGIQRDMRKYELWYQMSFFQTEVIKREREA